MTGSRDAHPIRIEPNPNRVRVRHAGHVIADTTRALTLFEAGYPGVVYIPRADADLSLLERTSHQTKCPYKGIASYFTIVAGDRPRENAIWELRDAIAGRRRHCVLSRVLCRPRRWFRGETRA